MRTRLIVGCCLGMQLIFEVVLARSPVAAQVDHAREDGISVSVQPIDGGTLWTATADLSRAEMVIVPQGSRDGIRVRQAVKSVGGRAGINGGFFSPEHLPTGIEVISGRTRGRVAKSQRLLVKGPQGWDVVRPADLGITPQWEYALQSGPILIERPGVLGIRHDGGPSARRSAVCVGSKSVTIAATDASITLYRWALVLLEQARATGVECTVALNLDGGPSTGFYAGERGPALNEEWSVANVLVLKPR